MAVSGQQGPFVIVAQPVAVATGSGPIGTPSDYNPDAAPSLTGMGDGLLDPRFPVNIGNWNATEQSGTIQAIGWLDALECVLIDQVPAPSGTAVIAALQHATTTGVALTLVSTTTSAASVATTAFTVPQTGNVVPAGAIVLDTQPALVAFGQTGAVNIPNPANNIARNVRITGVSGGAGGTFTVTGYDLYGVPMHENITVGASVTTQSGNKAFKWVSAVTPLFADAHNYSVGQGDVFGFPIRADKLAYTTIYFNNLINTSSTGFTAASTSTATATTGDVRGTFSLVAQSLAADGTKQLQVFISPSVANINTNTGMFGVTQF